jgi:hypothetical protein
MTYYPSLRSHNEAIQAQATGRMMSVWLSNKAISVRGLAEQANVSTSTSRLFLQAMKHPSATVTCIVRTGFSCKYQNRVFHSGQHLQLSLKDYQARQVQVEAISLVKA